MNGEFIHGLFNDAVSNTGYTALNGGMTVEMNWKDVEGSCQDLI
jgi:hypothetical protein